MIFKFAFTLFLCVAISIFFALAAQCRKRLKRNQRTKSSPCYLETEAPNKPQSEFKRVLAENSYAQFKHLKFEETSSAGECVNVHPYKKEIEELLKNLTTEFVELFDGELTRIEDTECVWVETMSQLEELAEVLSKERVFGVDTEQHSLRSFLGFTALIQISTRSKDYLVDTIALHDVIGILRQVFANPHICKVFHGADNDVLWLQRDFHIYVVNLFDTAKACEVLSKPQKSLAYLLETYCGVIKNKVLQREDWRPRPLSAEMVEYARTDAHYLLHVANCLVSELKTYVNENSACLNDTSNLVLESIRRSNVACLQLYTKDTEAYPGESAAASICSRYSIDQRSFHLNVCDTKESCSCLSKFQILIRRLCAWREIMARIHDESLKFVLSDQAIGAIAAQLPTTETEIYETISTADISSDYVSLGSFIQTPSPVVCSHLEDFDLLLPDNVADDDDDLCHTILQRHLRSDENCPLSIYNYYLLTKTTLKLANGQVPKPNGFFASKVAARKNSRKLFVKKFSCKSPVYHNCKIYANDGRLLCYCDRKKLEWYLNRKLAKLVEDDPPAIVLQFEPKGRPEDEGNDFYIQSKKNICVGCGEGNHYLRYRIIPSCYRIHFPEHLKSHRSHDIVLLCVDCHEVAHVAAEKCKQRIAKEFGIPLHVRKVIDPDQVNDQVKDAAEASSDVREDERGVSPLQLRAAAMALLRHGSRMPQKRREQLRQIVATYYGGREISNEDVEQACVVGMSPYERRRVEKKRLASQHSTSQGLVLSQSTKEEECKHDRVDADADAECTNYISVSDHEVTSENPKDEASSWEFKRLKNRSSKYSSLGHWTHGKQVIDYIQKEYGEDGILQFCQRWRQVLIEAIHPRYLPSGWDVKHSGRRDFGEFSVYKPVKEDLISTAE